ncbi:energy-coupling factor transporter transmembrane component T [Crassaminicella profunda]|uniref:energy-coupling factor transporter transmembrane component T n=1 Tax=Crassaminicella profunda TaxID=1286698 RepID=UPI001CA6D805|nr:energy-coupling factor transporter transmembrane component T [Crassaminicella profunda]QZY55700.1 energy-coupling factor transporter transmembrane protein EcfT [Crassaminicella profunda]
MVKIHPFTMILFSSILFFMILVYSHPLYIMSILIFIILTMLLLGESKILKQTMKYGVFMSIWIILINPLVSQSGRTILLKSPRLFIIPKLKLTLQLKITLESLAYGGNMALKLFCILLIFSFFSVMTDPDENFSFFSKYAHKLTLILSMSTNIIHRLKLEIMRVKDVMVLRGVNFREKNLIKRVKAYYPILKVIFISSLEGSLDRAESLYARGYGKGVRTSYSQIRMKRIDYLLHGMNLILLFLLGMSIFSNVGFVSFYPTFGGFDRKDIIFLIYMNIALVVALLFMRGCKKWKFLR